MILDTNAVSALFAGEPALEEILAERERHQIPVIVVGEYLFGLAASKAGGQLRTLLDQLIAGSEILEVDAVTTEPYADIRSTLRQRGQPIPENDVWIAALCVQHRAPILTRDTHFDGVPGVRRISW